MLSGKQCDLDQRCIKNGIYADSAGHALKASNCTIFITHIGKEMFNSILLQISILAIILITDVCYNIKHVMGKWYLLFFVKSLFKMRTQLPRAEKILQTDGWTEKQQETEKANV